MSANDSGKGSRPLPRARMARAHAPGEGIGPRAGRAAAETGPRELIRLEIFLSFFKVGWFAFGETLTVMDIAGMALLAGALVLARSAPPPKLA